MRDEVLAIVAELKRLRKEGVGHVPVSDETIQLLKKFSIAGVVDGTTRAEVLDSIPEQVRSATASDFDRLIQEVKKPASVAAIAKKSQPVSRFPRPPIVSLVEGDKQAQWEALRERVLQCPVCNNNLKEGKKLVFGIGNLDAEIFICGEAPGAEEELQGEPFVGPAGQLLDKMIVAAGLKREDVYIGNIMNWRPDTNGAHGNRPPNAEELAFCLPYLKAQVEIVKPKLILALGVTASKGLLGADTFRSLREIKGKCFDFEGTPVIPSFHPSYLLRNTSNKDKRFAWEDWLKMMEKAELPISDRQRHYFMPKSH